MNDMTPKERLERIFELLSQAALRLVEKGGTNNHIEEEKPSRWKVIQVEKKSDGLVFKIQVLPRRVDQTVFKTHKNH
ncbi:hypothetical protein BVX98_01075 [bacterium F11]|nr:hypothetical protein BVX98_01075 [bacterium F11]